MAIKKEKTVLVQTRIPASLHKVLEQRAAEEIVSVAALVRRAILFTEENRAKKGKH